MKRNVRIFAVAALAAFASAATAQTVLFEETFAGCDGTGGNDGSWSGNIASTAFEDSKTDNSGWSATSPYAADECIKLGTGKIAGSATTPSLTKLTSDDATLTFRAGAWNSTSDGTTLSISISGDGASLSVSSVTLERGAFNTYTVKISGGLETSKITFTTSAKRFFLDDVKIVSGWVDDETIAAPTITETITSFVESTTVTIKAEEGASIYYTIDGTEPTTSSTLYSEPFVVTATATVKAIAVKGEIVSDVTTKELTKIEVTSMTLADVAAWIAEKDITKASENLGYVKVTFNNAKVLWVDEAAHYAYVREGDATAAINLYYFTKNDKAVTAEDAELIDIQDNYVISGEYKCQLKAYYGVAQISSTKKDDFASDPTVLTISSSSEVAEPLAVTLDEIEACKYICNLVVLEGVTLYKESGDSPKYYWISKDENDVEISNPKIADNTNGVLPTEDFEGKTYTIKAIVSSTYPHSDKAEGTISVISCVEEAENPGTVTAVAGVAAELDENAPIYNLQGQRVSKDAKGILIQNGKKFVVK
ncbi:MAG: hypothetical protein E7069_10750 [Bacteroidales bacterium]|jgi:hypothetical protein|nr:hypothetical protein [Bacteroidales bacterium]